MHCQHRWGILSSSMLLSRTYSFYSKILEGFNKPPSSEKAVLKEAEAVVGYPTSFLNLKFLLSDEVANIGFHLRKLIGTKHPLLTTITKELFVQNELPPWGLIVLLVAKAADANASTEIDSSTGILITQRAVAEITEMIHKSIQIHKGILNLPHSTGTNDVLNFGNKMALLSGDFLLSKSYKALANIRNQEVTEIISIGLRDLIASEFVGPRDKQNNPLPARPIKSENSTYVALDKYEDDLKVNDALGHWKEEWFLRNSLSGTNLLGRACQSCFILANHNNELSKEAFIFGKAFALFCQSCLEHKTFLSTKLDKASLISLSTMLYLNENPEGYLKIEKGFEDVKEIDYSDLYMDIIQKSSINKCKEIRRQLYDVALKKLDKFPEKSACSVLRKILNGLESEYLK